jgi:hypothetical protein
LSLVGQTLGGRYKILSLLGKGGMGAVYEAEQTDLRRRVAVKVLTRAGDPEHVLRFKQEALAAAGLAHPNIVQVLDFVEGDEPLLVMELLRGRSLAAIVRQGGKLEPARAVSIMTQVLSALAAAHEARIVHRDVKPENILVCESPYGRGREVAKVLDFGLARPLDEEKRLARTRVGVAMGTPAYMAPEQARGESADVRVDVFAAGVTLYHALAGRRPFEGKTTSELLRAVKVQPPIPLDAVCPDLDLDLVRVVERSLSKDPAERFASARAFLEALTASRESKPEAPAPAPAKRASTARTRRPARAPRAALEVEPLVALVPPIAAGMVAAARFDEAGESALAVGPAGLARFRLDDGWSARDLPKELLAANVRGIALGPAGEALVFGESEAWMRASGAFARIALPDGILIRGAHVDHASHVAFVGSIGDEGAVVECAPSGVAVHPIGRGIAMTAVTRVSGALVACGERGTLCVVGGGRVAAHVAGRAALCAVAPLGAGFVAVGGGALVQAASTASDALAAATEAPFVDDELVAVRSRGRWICAVGRRVHVAELSALDRPASTEVEGTARDVWLGSGVIRVVLDDAAVLEGEILSTGDGP